VDGYTAFGAAITRDGFKQTMACPAPHAVLADLQVLATAPADMNARGYGDLLGKITAGADWLLADALEVEALEPFSWSLVQARLGEWLGQPAELRTGESTAVSKLFEGLIMSGLAMQNLKSSRPASGSEHQFSHLWEMEAIGHAKPEHPHGFKVGVGTIASAALYEQLFTRDLTRLDIDSLCQKWPSALQVEQEIRAAFDIPELKEKAIEESLAKYITPEVLRQRLILLKKCWPSLREKLVKQLTPVLQIREQLKLAGCPTDPIEIGLDLNKLRESYAKARFIRRRYTVFDLAFETGLLAECTNELFRPGGFWKANS
jgi:glycerol-1-phosphate dehydrogenase [NAD(P)+]